MPKEIIKANSCQYSTGKRSSFDPAIGSDDSGASEGNQYSELSYLAGSVGSNDMGYLGGNITGLPFAESADEWNTRYERVQRLRRHTLEQGSSTFAFPKDKSRGLTNR